MLVVEGALGTAIGLCAASPTPESWHAQVFVWARCRLPRLTCIQLLALAAHHHADLARGVGGYGGVAVAHTAASKHLQDSTQMGLKTTWGSQLLEEQLLSAASVDLAGKTRPPLNQLLRGSAAAVH